MHGISIKQKGFTFIEILIIVMIMGIVTMAALPVINSTLGYSKLSSAARVFVAGLEYAANLSIRYRRSFAVDSDIENNSFKIVDQDPLGTSGTIRLSNEPPVNEDNVVFNYIFDQWYIEDLDTIGTFSGVNIDAGPGKLSFYPDGHCEAGENSYQDSRFVLRLGDLTTTIVVDGISGRIWVE